MRVKHLVVTLSATGSAGGDEELLEAGRGRNKRRPCLEGKRKTEKGSGGEPVFQRGPSGRIVGGEEEEREIGEGRVVADDENDGDLGGEKPETVDDVVGIGSVEVALDFE